jgi:hypothetical protein
MKICHILRAVPGSGKSTLAEALTDNNRSSTICCADDYFMHGDEYRFDPEKLGAAHLWCQKMFDEATAEGVEIVVVANTNTHERDVKLYRNMAIERGYTVFVSIVENWHKGKDVHNVPDDVKDKMRNCIKQNMKL